MVMPLCRHFGPCGGCDWQDRLYAEQLTHKRARLADLLETSLGARAPTVQPLVGMRVDETGWPWRFRHKASFVFGQGADGRTTIGHYTARSSDVVAIVECPVHADRANRLAFALHDHLSRARVPAAGPSLSGVLRHLIVRTTRDGREVGAMLVVTRNEKSLRKPIKAFLATEEAPDGFYLNVHDRPGPHMLGRETMRLSGRSHVKETVNGFSYLLSPTAFFQTNVDAADVIVRLVREAIPEAEPQRILDLYSGSGLFTVPLAARGHSVTAVEENRQAIEDLEANLRLNRVSARDVRLQAARVEDALQRLARDKFDTVILDPPRQGCPPEVIERVFTRMKPRRVVYVSCNPEALAAEMPSIIDAGYSVDRIQPVDMFPHTTHIETLVTFSRLFSRGMRGSATAPRSSPTRRGRLR
jgi:23S rRNA (uracil1939-C5)-methyltransferase